MRARLRRLLFGAMNRLAQTDARSTASGVLDAASEPFARELFAIAAKRLKSHEDQGMARKTWLAALQTIDSPKLATRGVDVLLDRVPERALTEMVGKAWQRLSDKHRVQLRRETQVVIPLDYTGHDLKIGCESWTELRRRSQSAEKEPELVDWIESWVRPGDVLFDIGANVGTYSLIAAARHGEAVRLFAFEPSYINFAQLVKNIFLNRLETVITPLPFALADRTELAALALSDVDEEGRGWNYLSRFVEEGVSSDKVDPQKVRHQSVLVYRLDECIDRLALPMPHHWKLDIDGFELALLKGSARTLASPQLRSIHAELNPSAPDFKDSLLLLESHGFRAQRESHRTAGEVNYLFARQPL